MQSMKQNFQQSDSIVDLKPNVHPEGIDVKIEIANDEEEIPGDIASTETIAIKQEIDEPEYDISTNANSEAGLIETKLEFEEVIVNIPANESTSRKRDLPDDTDSKEKRSKPSVPEKCQICGQAFGSYSDYKQHSRLHEDNRISRCHYTDCNQIFKTPNLLLRHLSVRHATIYKAFECGICDQKYEFSEDCERHRNTLHPKPFQCFACKQFFAFKRDLVQHRQTEHPLSQTVSDEDDEQDDDVSETDESDQDSTSDSEGSSDEDVNFEEDDVEQHKCALCGCNFKSSHDLTLHVRSHNETHAFRCLIAGCEKIYNDAADRNKHTRRHLHSLEKADVTKPNECKFCRKVFQDARGLQRHISEHMAQEPDFLWYSCELCGERFSTAQHHRLHMNRHKGPKPFQCAECGKGFSTKYIRNRHEELDACISVEMVICCVDCDEEFESALKLSKHKEMKLCPGRKQNSVESN